jgi:cytochrome c-type biogenesis protein CcmH
VTVFWLIIGAMTAAAVLAVLVPLLRPRRTVSARLDYDLEVYRDQLAELDRDRQRGLVGDDEATAARLEIERRMLAASEPGRDAGATATVGGLPKAVAAMIAVALPVGALTVYLDVGRPGLPGQPHAERPVAGGEAHGPDGRALDEMAARLAQRLRDQPDDLDGWLLLARTYQTLGRYAEAATAFGRAAALAGGRAELQATYGEALVQAAEGIVSPAAREAFDAALELDPTEPRARYYQALATAQAGRFQEAIETWRGLAQNATPDAPWLGFVRERIARTAEAHDLDVDEALAGLPVPVAAGGPSPAEVAAAGEAAPTEQLEMIRGMVERLAARLEEDPNDVDGWIRLIRSYAVLDQRDKAAQAMEQAIALNAAAADRFREAAQGVAPGDLAVTGSSDRGTPGLGADAIAPAQDMSADARRAMIEGLVERLASRLERQPDDLEGWIMLARAYGEMGRRADEAEALGRAAGLAPERVDIKVMRARAISAQSDDPPPPEAVAEMRRVLALEPDNVEAMWVVGIGEARDDNRAAAADLFRRVIDAMPPDAPERAIVQERLDAVTTTTAE